MQPTIEFSPERKLAGKKMSMCFADNRVAELWKTFRPHIASIGNRISTDLISLAVYAPDHFTHFDPHRPFEKWAAVEVNELENIPEEFDQLMVPAGPYAVFHYKGSSADPSIFQYIYGSWLQQSGYKLDHRPHFEVLGSNYKNNHPDSEETIWIPVIA